jgi:proteasome alpha subunit
MTEEPYRWIEAIGNRREYVQGQIRNGSPVFAVSLDAGIVLLGVGTGQSKVFEIYDRHALAGLGHPSDLERLRQALIDAAHLEGFSRAPEDVSLRRLVSFGLGPQLKTAFEQLFSPPFLARLLLAEVADIPSRDVLLKVHFDGTFNHATTHVAVLGPDQGTDGSPEAAIERWLASRLPAGIDPRDALGPLLTAWKHLTAQTPLPADGEPAGIPDPVPRVVEAALLRRSSPTAARYLPLPLP